jgi:hypothetical protein
MALLKVWSKVNGVYYFSEKNYPLCCLQYKSEHILYKENFDNKYVTTENFLILSFRRVLNLICFLLGVSPASEC